MSPRSCRGKVGEAGVLENRQIRKLFGELATNTEKGLLDSDSCKERERYGEVAALEGASGSLF